MKDCYKKPEAVRELERMADAEARRLHPTCPALAPRKFRDDCANSLTACIVKYITLKGGFASRISNQGTFNRKLNKYILSTSRKGLADVMGTYKKISLHVEVKIRRDRQSESQKKIESEVIRAGGRYYLARNFTDFKQWFDSI
jgi:uncharacterized membrane protein YheB (UPF0754 family)